MIQRFRCFTAGGSGGSLVARATLAAPVRLEVDAGPQAVNAPPASTAATATAAIRFIVPLLRRFPARRANARAAVNAAGTVESAPPSGGRARRRAAPAPRSGRRP